VLAISLVGEVDHQLLQRHREQSHGPRRWTVAASMVGGGVILRGRRPRPDLDAHREHSEGRRAGWAGRCRYGRRVRGHRHSGDLPHGVNPNGLAGVGRSRARRTGQELAEQCKCANTGRTVGDQPSPPFGPTYRAAEKVVPDFRRLADRYLAALSRSSETVHSRSAFAGSRAYRATPVRMRVRLRPMGGSTVSAWLQSSK
jgi:hypothetical protein